MTSATSSALCLGLIPLQYSPRLPPSAHWNMRYLLELIDIEANVLNYVWVVKLGDLFCYGCNPHPIPVRLVSILVFESEEPCQSHDDRYLVRLT